MKPSYMSMYFPAEGLILAVAKVLTGHPWYGILCMTALMSAAICWMLQGWLPPTWALLGGMLAVLRIGLFSYWINTYMGAGSIAALGGALVLGSLPRFLKKPQLRYSLLLALGIVLLGTTRPYEGLLLCLPVGAVLGYRLCSGRNQLRSAALVHLTAAPLAIVLVAGAWMGYYNYRVFGNPFTLPYTANRATYAMARYFVWQSPRPEPVYRHDVMRQFYNDIELKPYESIREHLFYQTVLKAIGETSFFAGIALLPPLLMFRRVLVDRRTRFLVVCAAVMMVGMVVQIFLIPHYLAPFTAMFYALGLQAMRHLRLATINGHPVGIGLVRLIVSLCVVLAGIRLFAVPLHLSAPEWPVSAWNIEWYGPIAFGQERADVEEKLERFPGQQLVIVRYCSDHNPLNEWVYNAPDIDDSRVIWAREMDTANNLELIRYYHGRHIWLVQPDTHPTEVSPYPVSDERGIASRGASGADSSIRQYISGKNH
ncbi:MAG: hypothetical protein WA655_02815 [Candidatus Korobacteraceae bacterium]